MSYASEISPPPVSRLKGPKIPHMHPWSVFFQAWSHCGEKPTPSLPSLHCSVSRGQPVTGTNISKPPGVRTVWTSLSYKKGYLGCVVDFQAKYNYFIAVKSKLYNPYICLCIQVLKSSREYYNFCQKYTQKNQLFGGLSNMNMNNYV